MIHAVYSPDGTRSATSSGHDARMPCPSVTSRGPLIFPEFCVPQTPIYPAAHAWRPPHLDSEHKDLKYGNRSSPFLSAPLIIGTEREIFILILLYSMSYRKIKRLFQYKSLPVLKNDLYVNHSV
ncbi:hypothetical protein [Enterobacter sp. 638]|uniref:hypothetical protein n=1 Tax=Enterobacter sp. (strain 638) TaxID=399742 RepID=UPI00167FC131|nr:hypothetical protein [Enterobacter sp. 638]